MELNEETGKYYHSADSAEDYPAAYKKIRSTDPGDYEGYRPDHYIEIAADFGAPELTDTEGLYYGSPTIEELYVVLYKEDIPVAEVNLATLFALASS
jgi:hypothetical protein